MIVETLKEFKKITLKAENQAIAMCVEIAGNLEREGKATISKIKTVGLRGDLIRIGIMIILTLRRRKKKKKSHKQKEEMK